MEAKKKKRNCLLREKHVPRKRNTVFVSIHLPNCLEGEFSMNPGLFVYTQQNCPQQMTPGVHCGHWCAPLVYIAHLVATRRLDTCILARFGCVFGQN